MLQREDRWARLRYRWFDPSRLRSRQGWLAIVVAAALAVLVIPPIIFLISTSFHSWQGLHEGPLSLTNFEHIFDGDATFAIIGNTLVYALGSTAIALVVGSGLAWLVERTNTPFKSVVYIAAFIALATPGVVNVIGWILLLGPDAGLLNSIAEHVGLGKSFFDIFSMTGMILVESLQWTPVVFLLMVTPFKFMDPSLEEAGMISGASRWMIFKRITIKLAWPGAMAALMLSLIRTLESFETPALIGLPGGVKVLTSEIYLQVKSGFIAQYGAASAYAIVLILFVLVLLWNYSKQTANAERFATVTGKGYRPNVTNLGRWKYLGGAICLLVLLVVLLPILILLWASFQPYYRGVSFDAVKHMTFSNYPLAFKDSAVIKSIINTIIAGGASGIVVMLLALGTSWVMVRTKFRARGALDLLASMPLVIPGVVAGIAVLRTYIGSPLPVYGTIWILAIAYTMRYIPYGMRYAHSGIMQMHKDLEESAEVSGAKLGTRFRRIVIPLTLPSLLGGFIFTFLNSSSQLAIPLMLSGPDSQVVSVSIFDLYQNGSLPELAAFSVCITVGVIGIAYGAYRITRSYGL